MNEITFVVPATLVLSELGNRETHPRKCCLRTLEKRGRGFPGFGAESTLASKADGGTIQ